MEFLNEGYGDHSKHFLEDFIEFGLLDLVVSRFIDSSNELIDFGLADLSVGFHVGEGIVDEVEDFVGIKAVAFVSVILVEDGIDGISELLFVV